MFTTESERFVLHLTRPCLLSPSYGTTICVVAYSHKVHFMKSCLLPHGYGTVIRVVAYSSKEQMILTLYNVSSQIEVRKQVHSRGFDSLFKSSSRSRNI
jgi:hypothetical protein